MAGEVVDALSIIVPEEKARSKGLAFVNSLKELIPDSYLRWQFKRV